MMPEKHLQWLRTVPLILLGNAVYALAVTAFILPTGRVTGGSTGLALVFYHGAGVPVTLFVSAFNLLMFLVGLAVLGRQFALTTLLSTVSYPLILGVLERLPQLEALTSDRMLAAVYGGLMIGLGIGIVIKAGASTGGMDIPPLVLRKKLGIPVSLSMYGFDFLILLFQMRFADQEQVLYGLLMVLIYTTVLDKVLLFGQARTQVKVVSEQYEQINREIIQTLDRGSTLIHAETGYLRTCRPVVLTVVSNRELPRLNELILSIDPNAFMVINRVSEVKGRGFTLSKENRAPLLEPEEPPGGSQA